MTHLCEIMYKPPIIIVVSLWRIIVRYYQYGSRGFSRRSCFCAFRRANERNTCEHTRNFGSVFWGQLSWSDTTVNMRERTPSADDTPKRAPPAPPRGEFRSEPPSTFFDPTILPYDLHLFFLSLSWSLKIRNFLSFFFAIFWVNFVTNWKVGKWKALYKKAVTNNFILSNWRQVSWSVLKWEKKLKIVWSLRDRMEKFLSMLNKYGLTQLEEKCYQRRIWLSEQNFCWVD